jgi:multiple sugar transport system ATP-binding protein
MNFLKGRVGGEGGPAFISEDGSVFPLAARGSFRDGQRVLAGIRPEAIVIDPSSPAKMRIELVEPTGAETHLFGRLGGAEVAAVVRDRAGFALGAEIGVSVDPLRLHLFDPASEARLTP